MRMVELIGYVAGVLTTIAFAPQVLKIRRSRSARDVSLAMYGLFVAGVSLWLIYGVMTESPPVVAANAATLVLALWVVIMKLRFG